METDPELESWPVTVMLSPSPWMLMTPGAVLYTPPSTRTTLSPPALAPVAIVPEFVRTGWEADERVPGSPLSAWAARIFNTLRPSIVTIPEFWKSPVLLTVDFLPRET